MNHARPLFKKQSVTDFCLRTKGLKGEGTVRRETSVQTVRLVCEWYISFLNEPTRQK
jgi:hypothetical protein